MFFISPLLFPGAAAKEEQDDEDGDEAKEDEDKSRGQSAQTLTVEQVKVIDSQGNLRVIFPSRVDLQNPNISVVRNYE